VMMVAPSGVSGINSQHDDQRHEQQRSHGNPTPGWPNWSAALAFFAEPIRLAD